MQSAIARTRQSITQRCKSKQRAGATASQLRDTLANYPDAYDAAEIAGMNLRTASADELFDLLYGINWSRAWGKPLSDYFNTHWGV